MEDQEILCKFLECNINVHPKALEELRNFEEREFLQIVRESQEHNISVFTLEFLKKIKKKKVVVKGRKKNLYEEYDAEIKINKDKDITGRSFCAGNIENFVNLFNNRYEVLSRIFKSRQSFAGANYIEVLRRINAQEVSVVGIVNDVRETKKGHVVIELEDPSGIINALVLNKEEDLKALTREIIKDEVIGVRGRLSRDFLIVQEIEFPDVPHQREVRKSPVPLCAVFISDIHIGSTQFLEHKFTQFIRWLRGEEGNAAQRRLASRVKYIVVGGDVVDGVGIYPEQKEELSIKSIDAQYSTFYKFVEQIPEHIHIIIIPGNHDATRQAEPQPAIEREFAPELYEDSRIHMAGNPVSLELHSVRVLSYHGRSLDDIISAIPGLSYRKPAQAMVKLLKKRHLSPIYGGKVPLAPENIDYLVIEEPPEILHMGHVHTCDITSYRNTVVVNSGTFQAQTSFQKKMNLTPTPGIVPIVDLSTLKAVRMEFV